jgi:uncharacterized protein (DUF849 family)
MGGYEPMIINVALTGAVPTKADNPAVPVTPEEIAADAIACAAEGASIVHVHVRDEGERPIHRRDLYERAIGPIRAARPDLVVCATTSSRVDPDVGARMTALQLDPELRPDMASLTVGSFNFPRTASVNPPDVIVALLEEMQARGIRPELEVFEIGMVNTLHALQDRGLIPQAPYVNILLGSLGSAPAFAADLGHIVERLPADAQWAAAGIGIYQRPITMMAAAMGGNVRTGMEDNPKPADAGTRWGNVDAVRVARAAAELAGRRLATPTETRRRLGLPERTLSEVGAPGRVETAVP